MRHAIGGGRPPWPQGPIETGGCDVPHHYAWLIWSSTFLLPWLILYWRNPDQRTVMLSASAGTSLLGLTEPIFVPEYWSPPSLFELARRTGFDIESLIFAFAIGGIGSALYHTLAREHIAPGSPDERTEPLHRFHRAALLAPVVLFPPLYLLPWNPIYPAIVCLALGAILSVVCRPSLARETVVGGLLFLGLYAVFIYGLYWLAPGYIAEVWNLPALRGGLVFGVPTEELLFGFAFGLYWTGVYEHFTWMKAVPHAARSTRRRP